MSASTQNQALAALLFLYREVLGCDPGWLDDLVRAKRPQRLPVVLTRAEVARAARAHLTAFAGSWRRCSTARAAPAGMPAAAGEGHRVRAAARSWCATARGTRIASRCCPARSGAAAGAHLERVRALHARDLAAGFGRVQLPDALARKYPNADREWGWQWVFPASKICRDPRFGEPQRGITSTSPCCSARSTRPRGRRTRQAGRAAHVAPLLRDASAGRRATTSAPCRSCSATATSATTMIYTHVLNRGGRGVESPVDHLLAGCPSPVSPPSAGGLTPHNRTMIPINP